MLLNTEKCEKLSLQKVFQRNKQSVNQTKIIITIIIIIKTKMEVLCAEYNFKKKKRKKKEKKIKLIREYTYLCGS